MGDWEERNKILIAEMENYCDRYRERICNNRTENQHKCEPRTYPSGKTYCDKMILARLKKFRTKINDEVVATLSPKDIV